MRLDVSVGCWNLVLESRGKFSPFLGWDNFDCVGGYPRILFQWKVIAFSVQDF